MRRQSARTELYKKIYFVGANLNFLKAKNLTRQHILVESLNDVKELFVFQTPNFFIHSHTAP